MPGTVAGLHLAWKEQGKLPWKRLVDPAIALARDGFPVSEALARSLKNVQRAMQKYPGVGRRIHEERRALRSRRDAEAARPRAHAERIATQGPAGFYEGETALLLEKEMLAHGGLITRDDLEELHRGPARAGQGHATAATRSSRCRRPRRAAWR